MRVPYPQLHDTLARVLRGLGFAPDDADLCARLFAEASRDGVASHGLNRFPRFVQAVRDGVVDPRVSAERVSGAGPLERWDGRRGPGNLNAHRCMERAITLAREHGIGCVALANTNHWMRGGSYGWQAADAGVIGICWTNTMPNLPPWGASDPRLGNNPLVVAVPRGGAHVVLDMAMSQFSMGALESYRRRGEALPVPGGFDRDGEPTRDPAAIEESGRLLPIGYWKGSGLALVLDMVAAILAGGLATHQVPSDPARESGLSQLFLALDPAHLGGAGEAERVADEIVGHLQAPDGGGEPVRYPGERTLRTREESLRLGVPVDPEVWARVLAEDADAGG
ncbi:MAG: 3-dehydro-L-gulonate 2-dehydrogenase [Gemmatimonadetes bacterium]|nr:3-dehydro-L-gulonate 2-dehydrogenase [Gemmatimonadota bacterium]